MKPPRISSPVKLVAAWLIILAVIGLAAEGGARLLIASPDAALVQDVHESITVPGIPGLADAVDFDYDLFWVLKPNLNGLHVAGKFESNPVDFSVSTTASRVRCVPPLASPELERYRVLAIGDSCTFGFGVQDDEAWPAQLQALLNADRTDGLVRVINAGVPGYTSYQGLRYLNKEAWGLRPNLVIVSFWINDQVPSFTISDQDRAAQLVVLRWESPLRHSRFYCGLKQLVRPAMPPSWTAKGSRARLTEQEYTDTLTAICQACAARNVPVVFVIWPLRWQVKGHVKSFGYQDLAAQVAQSAGAPLVSVAAQFIDSGQDPFIDPIHGNPAGCALAARAIAPEVRRLLEPR